jgi:predicted HicB family RNase H-like nuclease
MITHYTPRMAKPPSLSEDLAASVRVSLVRAGEGGDGAWVAEVDGAPGVSARGATPEEAVRHALDGVGGVTEPAGPEGVTQDAPKPENGARRSGRLLVRMPASLHDELARAAELEGVSLNQLITGALAGAVAWRSDGARGPQAPDEAAGRLTRIAVAVNLAVVGLVALVALALLVVAWRDGL